MALAPPPQLPNIPAIVAAYGVISQELDTIRQETAHFSNAAPQNIADQLAALAQAVAALTNTVANNHIAVTNNHIAATNNYNTVMARLNDVETFMPMCLINATIPSSQPLLGPNMQPLGHPHPLTRDLLLRFNTAQCIASAAAFNLPPAALPPGPTVADCRRQIARFLGVGFD
ncbi:hypothetical protein B0H19DRAFT_1271416 [Mycena capillaripes]|nr:hypothetical protein B0H19DRAFT_1271416 [Mycena capillaripes]